MEIWVAPETSGVIAFRSAPNSADPRELFAGKHIDYARAPDAGFHHDKTRMVRGDFADQRCVFAERMPAHRLKNQL